MGSIVDIKSRRWKEGRWRRVYVEKVEDGKNVDGKECKQNLERAVGRKDVDGQKGCRWVERMQMGRKDVDGQKGCKWVEMMQIGRKDVDGQKRVQMG